MKDNKTELEKEYQCDCEECNGEELYTQEQVLDIVEEITPKIFISTESCGGIELDKKEFAKGVKEVSNICGRISAILSTGVSKESVIDIIMNLQNIEFNKIVNTENNNTNKETAKLQNIQVQSQQI